MGTGRAIGASRRFRDPRWCNTDTLHSTVGQRAHPQLSAPPASGPKLTSVGIPIQKSRRSFCMRVSTQCMTLKINNRISLSFPRHFSLHYFRKTTNIRKDKGFGDYEFAGHDGIISLRLKNSCAQKKIPEWKQRRSVDERSLRINPPPPRLEGHQRPSQIRWGCA
jgi:hypothetical protein